MNDLEYLKMFRTQPEMRPLVLSYFIERMYGIETLIKYVNSQESYPIPDYSSWILTHIAKEHPLALNHVQTELIDSLLQAKNDTLLRNLSLVLLHYPIHNHRESELLNYLIEALLDPSHQVAFHVNCIHKLADFTLKYPELKSEIISAIEVATSRNKQASLHSAKRNYLKKTKKIPLVD